MTTIDALMAMDSEYSAGCKMRVHDVSTAQTLSRLNEIIVFVVVLDFIHMYMNVPREIYIRSYI